MNSEARAESASAAPGLVVPFGKYLLLHRVSVGGMAEVFKALPEGGTRVDQIVAIKRILPSIAEDGEFIAMFVDEARLAGQLNHPNICRIYELGRVGDDHYIAMQFLWGRDLLKVLNRFRKAGVPIPVPFAALVAAKAAAALHYAHTKCDASGSPLHIIHRDVSPQNIVVGYSGQVKLIDFGVARAASQSRKTQAGILKGKFGYMSPEMIRGLPVDHRSDVFAMGICLYEVLTGGRLFLGDTDFATLELVRDAVVPPPSLKVPGIPPEIDAITLKALSRDADDRFPSALALQQALEAYLAAHHPGFSEADLSASMQEAFSVEIEQEQQRLREFSELLREGPLRRGVNLGEGLRSPASAPESAPESDHEVQPSAQAREHASTGEGSPDEALEEDDPALIEEQTQIYFSAEQPTSASSDDAELKTMLGPAPDKLRPRRPANYALTEVGRQENSPVTSSGTYARPLGTPKGTSAGAWRRGGEARIPTLVLPAFDPHSGAGKVSRLSGRTSWTVAALMALGLVVTGYAVARLAQSPTASLEIAAVGGQGALVRVDGVVRGNPPLRVDGLEPGVHEIEVEANGYLTSKHKLHVEAGEVSPVKLVLERDRPPPSSATSPSREGQQPRMEPLPQAEPETTERAPRHDTRPPSRRAPGRRLVAPTLVAPPAEAARLERTGAARPAETGDMGELLISTLPWSRVFIDGADTGRDTPIRAMKIAPGSHRVGLRTPDGLTRNIDIYVEPGQIVRIVRKF